MRKLKGSETYGQVGQWQIVQEQRKEIEDFLINRGDYVPQDDIDMVVEALDALGFIEVEPPEEKVRKNANREQS